MIPHLGNINSFDDCHKMKKSNFLDKIGRMGGWVGNTHWVFASSSLAFSQIWDSRQIKSFQQGSVKLLLHRPSDSFPLANNQLFESLFHSQGDFSQSLQEGGRGRKKYFKDKGGLNLLPFTFHLSLTFPLHLLKPLILLNLEVLSVLSSPCTT